MNNDYSAIFIQAGEPGKFDQHHAEETVAATRLALTLYPYAMIEWWVHGFDADPRSLWDIPEAAAQIRRCARMMGWTGYNLPDQQLSNLTKLLLIKCQCFGDDHPYTVKISE